MIENASGNEENQISVIDFAAANGLNKQYVFKVIKRLEIETIKIRGGRQHNGKPVSYISKIDATLLLTEIAASKSRSVLRSQNTDSLDESNPILSDIGIFYLIQLEPEHDPNRIKVGFANNIDERLRQHRCSAPFAQVLETWPCKRLWEKTAIECVTADCVRLHTEVFRTTSLENVVKKCSQFFSIMPPLSEIEKQKPEIL